jgi:hypothetical protein
MVALVTTIFITGCACGQIAGPACPAISVSSSPYTLIISGANFRNIPQCAQLSLDGLPPPQAMIAIGQAGQPMCTGGAFYNFVWRYSLGCIPTSQQSVVVIAVDQSTARTASQSISFPWGPRCTLYSNNCVVGEQSASLCPTNSCNDGTCQSGIITSCLNPSQPICTNGCGGHGGVNPSIGCLQQ